MTGRLYTFAPPVKNKRLWCKWEPGQVVTFLHFCCFVWPCSRFSHEGVEDVLTLLFTDQHKFYINFLLNTLYFPLPDIFSISSHFLRLCQPLPFIYHFSVQPSPWPRKVTMETEADLMQRRKMNCTVRGSCVYVCGCVTQSLRELFWLMLIIFD